MEKIDQINLNESVKTTTRKQQIQAKKEQDKRKGYEELTLLCQVGEIEMARRLAERNPHWGYTVNHSGVQESRYEQLVELCEVGEVELAQELTEENPHWGYIIVEGSVQKKED
ncbi:hypothetical protein K4A83_18965 [Spirulina subsalsa FACHB-351]|uniref:Uncharacterized protein n=1 Tax=Spirulina subsalsa FACHB-351 TaxID=234711 RepID=A0ABT3LA00_9CYAN|nr:hypothetical protein [Spirulina subsalsa]MCW6038338.1 hypothetical protein [Spirulina subsalsa FACHB-351]